MVTGDKCHDWYIKSAALRVVNNMFMQRKAALCVVAHGRGSRLLCQHIIQYVDLLYHSTFASIANALLAWSKKELSGVNSATLHGVKRTFD